MDTQLTVVDRIVRERKATRAFLDTPISRKDVEAILESARWAPSNSNIQPWRTYIVTGNKRKKMSEELWNTHIHFANKYQSDYKHFPDVLSKQFTQRQADFAARYYDSLDIDRENQEARHTQTGRNFLFFGAPVGLIFTIPNTLELGSWIDYGIFLQTIMLVAKGRGIDTCPQISFAKYHKVIRRHLPLDSGETVICGMSMGYADLTAKVNFLNTPREPIETFTSFQGFDEEDDGNTVGTPSEAKNEQT